MIKKEITNIALLATMFLVFTVLTLTIDVEKIGPNQTAIGLASINHFIHESIGIHMFWYEVTDWMGLVPLGVGIIFGLYGLSLWIKHKSIKKVDPRILLLGAYHILIIIFYIFFETFIVNYRPVLMDGFLEPSYPSTHVFVSITVLGSAIMMTNYLFREFKWKREVNLILLIMMIVIVVGRFISGVHWFTDIIGSLLLSSLFLYGFKNAASNLEA